ncbi:MAG: hypothetical protein JXR34_02945, partial [Bacteroidales bacterium]|nr:hypothetical protein [Bacteroidales bacterium]
RGTDLEGFALDLKGFYILLIKPDFSISTAKAYSLIKSYSQPDSIKKAVSMPIDSWKNYLVNDFEIALQNEYPQIESLKQDLYRAGAVYASMSGSGSALFGIFSKLPQPINQPNLLQKVICL